MQEWRDRWEEFSTAAAEAGRKTMVERTRLEQLELGLARLVSQRERLEADRAVLAGADLASSLAELESSATAAQERHGSAQSALSAAVEAVHGTREAERNASHELETARGALQEVRGRLVSLQALQRAALGQGKGKVVEWLSSHSLDARPRLAQKLEVDPGWERAVETVLGSYLEAVVVDGLDAVSELVGELQGGSVSFVGGPSAEAGAARPGDLSAKVREPGEVRGLLAGVHSAESLADALARRSALHAGESIVTRDGLWIGPNWLRVSRDQDAHEGVIEREHEIRGLREAAAAAERRVDEAVAALDDCRSRLRSLEEQRDTLHAAVNESHRDHSSLRGRLEALRSRAQQATERMSRVDAELAEASAGIESDEKEIREARRLLEAGLAEMQQLDDRRQPLEQERGRLATALDAARTRAQADVAQAQQAAIRFESQRSTLASVRTSLERAQAQVQQYTARKDGIEQQLASADQPIGELEEQLRQVLESRLKVEQELTDARRLVDEADMAVREQEQERMSREAAVEAAREALEQVRMHAQESRVRRESLMEQFTATRLELAEVREQLPPEASVSDWQASLTTLQQKIERLGAVNLASIDELKEQTERKEYLDRQFTDLTDALGTLDEAIKKIDRETRTRFQDTFDRVNAGLQEKFPRLFGGGSAYLELVGEDPLSAGVAVMARPPGKRNSSISQLSGGEKALTAVALVFSIFELNPAPFCLLDEVDAPLDDHNVGRFCEIVRDMSERVQFIFITHNKSTMELAQQLIGVTMHEPGVSRLVAVDVDEAVRMAAS